MKILLFVAALLGPSLALAAKVSFENLKDGDTVTSPFTVKMSVEGMKVEPAGTDINSKTAGHHHLIVDGGPLKKGEVIPVDATHLHFGKGQVTTELSLSPGEHTLTLQFADGTHRSFGPE